MNRIFMLIGFLGLLSCNNSQIQNKQIITKTYAEIIIPEDKDTLEMISKGEKLKFDIECAFVDSKGDTVIPFGRFTMFDSVCFVTYAIVKAKDGVYGINRKGEIMFDAYLWGDVQLDEISEGLFRVIRNGKIGYANESGEILIPCQFKCAEQFKNGVAKVAYDCDYLVDGGMEEVKTKSDHWFYINHKGASISNN